MDAFFSRWIFLGWKGRLHLQVFPNHLWGFGRVQLHLHRRYINEKIYHEHIFLAWFWIFSMLIMNTCYHGIKKSPFFKKKSPKFVEFLEQYMSIPFKHQLLGPHPKKRGERLCISQGFLLGPPKPQWLEIFSAKILLLGDVTWDGSFRINGDRINGLFHLL